MVRLFNVYHPSRTFLLLCSEVILTVLCFVAAVFVLHRSESMTVLSDPLGVAQLTIMVTICLLCLHYFDLYDFRNFGILRELLSRLLLVLGTASLALGIIYLLFPGLIVVPWIYVLASPVLLCLLFGVRVAFVYFNQMPTQAKRVLLVGSSPIGCDLSREIRQRPELGINLVGYVDDSEPGIHPPMAIPLLGSTSELEEVAVRYRADAAIVAFQDRRGRLPVDSLLKLRFGGVKIQEARLLYEHITGKIPVEDLRPSSLIFSEGFCTHAWMIAIQRAYSFVGALIGLVFALPVMALVALATMLDSKGPLLISQARVGKDGQIFTLFKFRSMREDAEAKNGAVWTVHNDPRITRVGRIIRKFRLDELPQLWNVLRGDMNIVGPRPERSEFMQLLESRIPYYRHRHIVRPGITGWAQVRYNYGSTVEEQYEKLRHDLFYVKNISPSLDFYILFQTVKIILWGRGAK